jgi:methionine-rich copper-binding protein CopC/predicted  nucleic acid-binding Zn-ribbon protein
MKKVLSILLASIIMLGSSFSQMGALVYAESAPTISSISSSKLPKDYKPLTITAVGSQFQTDKTTVTLKNRDGGVIDGKVSNVVVNSSTKLTFNLGSGLVAGQYLLQISTPEGSDDIDLVIYEPTISVTGKITNATKKIKINGTNTNFSNLTSLLFKKDNQTINPVYTVAVISPTEMEVNLQSPLEAGSYSVTTTTGEEVASRSFSVLSAAITALTPDRLYEDYEASTISITGSNTSWSVLTSIQITKGESLISDAITNKQVASPTQMAIDLKNGLEAGTYTLTATTGSEEVTTSFSILEKGDLPPSNGDGDDETEPGDDTNPPDNGGGDEGGTPGEGTNPPSSGGGGGTEPPGEDDDTEEPPSNEEGTIVIDSSLIEKQTENVNGKTISKLAIKPELIEQVKSFNELVLETKKENPSDHVTLEISAKTFKSLYEMNKNGHLTFKTGDADYSLPLSQINVDEISKSLGSSIDGAVISIEIYQSDKGMDVLNKYQFEALSPVYEFNVTATANGKTVTLDKFNSYVTRSILTEKAINKNEVTALRINADGTYTVLPTLIHGNVAIIKSKTNSSYVLVTNNVTFEDTKNLWNKDEVHLMASKLLVKGKAEGQFKPQESISRVELAVLLTRALSITSTKTYDNRFSDVKGTEWFTNEFMASVEAGIIKGRTATTFDPNAPVSRQEAAAMIKRSMDYVGFNKGKLNESIKLTSFADYSSVSSWAKGDLEVVAQAKIISGKIGNKLDPQEVATRAEMVSILHRFMIFTELMN